MLLMAPLLVSHTKAYFCLGWSLVEYGMVNDSGLCKVHVPFRHTLSIVVGLLPATFHVPFKFAMDVFNVEEESEEANVPGMLAKSTALTTWLAVSVTRAMLVPWMKSEIA